MLIKHLRQKLQAMDILALALSGLVGVMLALLSVKRYTAYSMFDRLSSDFRGSEGANLRQNQG